MATPTIIDQGAEGETTEHAHRWRIEAQGGPTSAGSCACGAEKQFQNSWDQEPKVWSGGGTARRGRPPGKTRQP